MKALDPSATMKRVDPTASAADNADDAKHKLTFRVKGKEQVLHQNSYAFEPFLLKSGIFRPAAGARVTHAEYVQIGALGNTTVLFKGEELRQDDLRVLLALIKLRMGSDVRNVLQLTPRTFCRENLGWSDSSDSAAKLKASLLRLYEARLQVTYFNGDVGRYSFVADVKISSDSCAVWLGPCLVEMFQRNTTLLKIDQRLAMKDGLESWLYGVIAADSILSFDLHELKAAAGSTYEQKDFNKHIKQCCTKLKAAGIISKAEVVKGRLIVTKCKY